MLEIILISLFGIVIGTLLGLLPGMNVNNILPLLLSSIVFLNSPHYVAVLIVSVAVAQVFASYIPSIFLGAPGENTSLSVLPGHQMLFEGRGYEAVKLTIIGGLGSLLLTVFLMFMLSNYFTQFYDISRPYIGYVIMLVIASMVLTEREIHYILFSIGIIMLSGIFGIITLNSSFFSQQSILFPILAGLFGLSTVILSLTEKSKIPKQDVKSDLKISKRNILKSIILGSLFGIAVGFLPAVGVSQAATMAQYIGGVGDSRGFLVALSGINVANEVFSLNSLYLVDNPRSGASVAIERVLVKMTFDDVVLLTSVIGFVSLISACITLYLGKKIPVVLAKVNYKKLSVGVIVFLISMVGFATGWKGLIVLAVSTSIGILCNRLNVNRSNCMGVLLLPSVIFFLGLNPFVLSFLNI
ncbi:MAG TPA: tripartite tricarboxylate transporter permease [archaeon]|nr:tripartite tricarboxylate transporter permease [archaeon]